MAASPHMGMLLGDGVSPPSSVGVSVPARSEGDPPSDDMKEYDMLIGPPPSGCTMFGATRSMKSAATIRPMRLASSTWDVPEIVPCSGDASGSSPPKEDALASDAAATPPGPRISYLHRGQRTSRSNQSRRASGQKLCPQWTICITKSSDKNCV